MALINGAVIKFTDGKSGIIGKKSEKVVKVKYIISNMKENPWHLNGITSADLQRNLWII